MIIGSKDVADPHMSSGSHTFIVVQGWDELGKSLKRAGMRKQDVGIICN